MFSNCIDEWKQAREIERQQRRANLITNLGLFSDLEREFEVDGAAVTLQDSYNNHFGRHALHRFSASFTESRYNSQLIEAKITIGGLAGLCSAVAEHRPGSRAYKDGSAIVLGRFNGQLRGGDLLLERTGFGFDIDAMPQSEVAGKVEAFGKPCIAWESWSNGDTADRVSDLDYRLLSHEHGWPSKPTSESLAAYYAAAGKGWRTNVRLGSERVKRGRIDGEVVEYWPVTFDPESKLRLIYIFEEPMPANIPVEVQRAIYFRVAERIGLKVDPSCSDGARLHYLTVRRGNRPPSATTLYCPDGELLDWREFLPAAETEIASRNASRQRAVARFSTAGTPASLAEVEAALEAMSALGQPYPIERDLWRNIIFALASEFADSEHEDDVLALLEAFSASCPEKYREGEVEAIWGGAATRSPASITMGTFWFYARQAGFERTRPAKPCVPHLDLSLFGC